MRLHQVQRIKLGAGVHLKYESQKSFSWGEQTGIKEAVIFNPVDQFTSWITYVIFGTKILLKEHMQELSKKVGFNLQIVEYQPPIIEPERLVA